MKLTKKRVESAGPGFHWCSSLPGFCVLVSDRGTRTYYAQRRIGRREERLIRRVKIGRHGVITAEEARREAVQLLAKMERGDDPSEERKKAGAAAISLGEIGTDYLANRRRRDGKPLAEATKADIRKHLGKAFADWYDKPIANITREMVLKRYKQLAERSQAQGNQAMRVLSALINYASARNRAADGTPLFTDNPVDMLRETNTFRGTVPPRTTRVPPHQVGTYYDELERTRLDRTASLSVRIKATAAVVLLLTGLRKADLINRTWADIDLTAATLHVADTKHRSPRTFPLATQAVDALTELAELVGDEGFVFPTANVTRPVTDIRPGLQRANTTIGMNIVPHDLRRTWMDATAPECADVDPLVAELLSNRKGAAYQALHVRFEHYDQTTDLSERYRNDAQRIADYFDRRREAATDPSIIPMPPRKSRAD